MGLVTVQIQGADGTISNVVLDDVGGNLYPIYKLSFGALGNAGNVVSIVNPLPVTAAALPLPAGASTSALQMTDDYDTGPEVDTRRAAGLVLAEDGGGVLVGSANPMPIWDMLLEISKGTLSGHSHIHKFGENPDIDQTVEDIWNQGGTYTFMTVASTLYISSSAGGDNQVYEVQGLDADWNEQTVNVTANGNTFVALAGTWRRVFRVINRGATDNAGDIYISDNNTDAGGDGVPDTASNIKAKIDIGDNQTLMAIYTIPNGKTGYLCSWFASLSKKQAVSSIINLKVREEGGVFIVKERLAITSTGTSHMQHFISVPEEVPAKSDILITADSSANDVGISGGFDLILIDD